MLRVVAGGAVVSHSSALLVFRLIHYRQHAIGCQVIGQFVAMPAINLAALMLILAQVAQFGLAFGAVEDCGSSGMPRATPSALKA